MATIKQFRNKWYSRIRWSDTVIKKRMEKLVPLRTDSKTEAHKRNREVSRYEKDIINGLDFEFPWMADGGRTKVKELTLEEAINDWMERRRNQPDISQATIQMNENSIDHLFRSVSKTTSLKSITTKVMEDFADDLVGKGLSVNTVNIHLRSTLTFFRYVWKRGMIDRLPIIEQKKVGSTFPIYFSDEEFHAILDEVGADTFYGKVYFFYRETGLRLREPFIATLDGNWLVIPNTSKGRKERYVELDDFLIDVYKELRLWVETCGLVKGSRGRHLSKKLKKAMRKCGIPETKHFHSLRHTFAVRQRVIGTPMAMIQAMMGHRSITTTEIYAEFPLNKLKDHFPTLKEYFHKGRKTVKSSKGDTVLWDTHKDYKEITEGKLLN